MKVRSLFVAVSLLTVASAHAQATRTWVSGVGDDVNPCSRTAPCKTFAGAISKTASGGIIDAMDPGGYGTITITKPITIEGNGTLASILASGVQGVVVNITSGTNRDVVLRNLLIDGSGTTLGTNGINFIAGDSLTIEDSYIKSFSTNGILFQPNSTAKLSVKNTSVLLSGVGVRVQPAAGGFAYVAVRDSMFNQNATGFRTEDNSKSALWGTTVANNSGDGVFGNGTSAGTSVTVDNCEVSNNLGIGIHSNGAADVRVANTTITGNATGVSATASSVLISYQNNRLIHNSAPGTFTGTALNN